MPDASNSEVDRDLDVFVTSLAAMIKIAQCRRARSERGAPWNVFVGAELIEHYDDSEDAIDLARKVAAKCGRAAWISSDGVTFESITRG